MTLLYHLFFGGLKGFRFLVLIGMLVGASGCSTPFSSYERAWRKAAPTQKASAAKSASSVSNSASSVSNSASSVSNSASSVSNSALSTASTPIPQTGFADLDSLNGRWQGTWESKVNGHHGTLRCLMQEIEPGLYSAWFDSTFLRVVHFKSRTELRTERKGDHWQFEGEKDLGWWVGGLYTYRGEASPLDFQSTYHCKADHGLFTLKRLDVADAQEMSTP